MNIFTFFLSKKNMKICSKTHQIAPFKKISRGSMPPNPLANAWPSLPKSWPPLANPAYVHGLLLRNVFQEMRS